MDRVYVEKTIEMLQEMGRVCVNDCNDIAELQKRLRKEGIDTRYIQTDREYLVK